MQVDQEITSSADLALRADLAERGQLRGSVPVSRTNGPGGIRRPEKAMLATAMIAGGTFIVGWIAFLALLSAVIPRLH